MHKQSRLRALAKRALPERLRGYNVATTEAHREAKRPRLPRSVQRENRLAAKEADAWQRAERERLQAEVERVTRQQARPSAASA